MNVTVLYGGPSSEREVSLNSGRAVIEALRELGHAVHAADISPDDLSSLDKPADVIFPVLHGEFGEDGTLQQIMEARGLRFVGSGSAASRLGFDKTAAKRTWVARGLPTPRWREVHRNDRRHDVPAPCVVKAPRSGSSIDVFICPTDEAAANAVDDVLRRHPTALVEQFIKGVELTVGILEDRPLPAIRIATPDGFYGYEDKYRSSTTEYHFDTLLPDGVVDACQRLALDAFASLGCRDLGRVDMIVDAEHRPWLLEINTLPGFTARSLLPKAARQAGIEFNALVDLLVKRAAARSA